MSDRANDFWKCLANWLSSIRSGTIPAESTQFTLYVTPVKTGKRAAELSEATTSEQVEKLVNKIRVSLSKTAPAPTCLPYLQSFLNATPAERFAVIERFNLISNDADPVDRIRVLIAPVVAANLIDPLCQFVIGRAKESADRPPPPDCAEARWNSPTAEGMPIRVVTFDPPPDCP